MPIRVRIWWMSLLSFRKSQCRLWRWWSSDIGLNPSRAWIRSRCIPSRLVSLFFYFPTWFLSQWAAHVQSSMMWSNIMDLLHFYFPINTVPCVAAQRLTYSPCDLIQFACFFCSLSLLLPLSLRFSLNLRWSKRIFLVVFCFIRSMKCDWILSFPVGFVRSISNERELTWIPPSFCTPPFFFVFIFCAHFSSYHVWPDVYLCALFSSKIFHVKIQHRLALKTNRLIVEYRTIHSTPIKLLCEWERTTADLYLILFHLASLRSVGLGYRTFLLISLSDIRISMFTYLLIGVAFVTLHTLVHCGAPYKDCGSSAGTIQGFDVTDCTAAPCRFIKGKTYAMNLTFAAKTASKSASVSIYGRNDRWLEPMINVSSSLQRCHRRCTCAFPDSSVRCLQTRCQLSGE